MYMAAENEQTYFFAQTLGCLIYNVYLCNILCERLNLKHIININ